MKKRAILSILLVIVLSISAFTVYAADKAYYTFADGMGKDEIPYGEFGSSNTAYRYSSFKMMNAEQAKAAGVPEGYSGWVLAISESSSGVGIGLDLSHINVKAIEKITFRVWCPQTTKNDGVRLTDESASSWIMLADPVKTGEWVEVVLDESSNFNTDTKSFDVFDDGNGNCKIVNFCFRFTGSDEVAYIDSITVELKAPDNEPPVIEYNGEKTIVTTAGKPFVIDATAYDEYYQMNIEPEYVYSDGAVDKNGLLLEGEHTCTVKFSDLGGNTAELVINLKVGPKDTVAPVLSWAPEKIYASEGMMPSLAVTAMDDPEGEVEVTLVWSEGALYKGKLCSGNHTLTITAVDQTGNKAEKVIPVIVSDYAPPTQG